MLSPHARLYSEMVTAAALIHGDAEKLLRFNPAEHPVALQLGGCDPRMMADAAAQGVLDLISQLLINQQGFDVDFGEDGLPISSFQPEKICYLCRNLRCMTNGSFSRKRTFRSSEIGRNKGLLSANCGPSRYIPQCLLGESRVAIVFC